MIIRLFIALVIQLLFIQPPTVDISVITNSRQATLKSTADLSVITHQTTSAPISATNDCGLTLTTELSGCYSVSGVSKVTLSTEVSWTAIPDGAVITVQVRDQTKTITLRDVSTATDADVRSPQVVAFEIEADSAPANVVVTYGSCVVSDNLTAPAPCPVPVCTSLGGTVFKDFNADGVHQDGESTGLPDIIVRAITTSGTSYTAATDSIGKYTIAVPTEAYPVRIEFTNIPTYAGNGTPNGPDGRTTVQFVSAPDCQVDLGVLNAQEYCQTDPLIMVPCFVNGDPLPNGSSSGAMDALVAFPYSLRGNKNESQMTPMASASQVGSLWGIAYSKFTKQLYTSAVMRRHVGLGPGGLGGIYVTDVSGPTISPANTSLFVNLTDLGIDLGTMPSNSDRGLPAVPNLASYDPVGFSQVGKIGIGDLELAEDGSLLWFTNLNDGQLYSLRVPSAGAPGPNDWAVHQLPTDNMCTGGSRRIWGLKTYQGKVYIGTVCDASTSKNKSDLRAIVYAYTPGTGSSLGTGGTYTVVFDFPLTYPKGAPDRTDFSLRGWFPWEDTFANLKVVGTDNFIINPQPILTSIEFDIDGSMVLGFNDRTGLQLGYQNFGTTSPSETHYSNISGGDILRAYFSNGTYVLENGGKAGPNTGSSTSNNQGPGGGEFYNDDFYYSGALVHAENVNGSIAIRPGSGEVVASTMDPLNDQAWSGGVRYLSNTTGWYTSGSNVTSSYVVYRTQDGDGGTFGKATGLGGVALNCDLPNYLQIGNRVWLDSNQNGEQDPGEKGIEGVNVSLYQGTTVIATTTSDANGEYYFTYTPTISAFPGSTTALLPNTTYQIMFGTNGQFADNVLTANEGRYQLTVANATGATLNDNTDSDAQVGTIAASTAPFISVTTGYLGSVDHSFDVGFYCLPTAVVSVSVTAPTCPTSSIVANDDGRIDLTGIQNGNKTFLYTTSTPPAYTATANSQTVVNGSVSYTGLANPTSSSGTSYSIIIYNGPCCYTIVSAVLPQNTCIAVGNSVVCAGESAILAISGCELGTINWSAGTTPSSGTSVVISTLALAGITSPTVLNYTATCTVGNNVATAVASVTVNPKPALDNMTSVCAGPNAYTIVLTGQLDNTLGSLTYELVRGSSFETGIPVTTGKTPLPATGILAPLQLAGLYWVRVYTETDCYSELSGEVQVCDCPPAICVPFVIERIR